MEMQDHVFEKYSPTTPPALGNMFHLAPAQQTEI